MLRHEKFIIPGLLTVLCVATIGTLNAQMPTPPPAQEAEGDTKRAEIMEELGEMQERIRSTQQELSEIAQQAQERDPELPKLQNELIAVYQDKLQEHGYPPEEELEKLRTMQQRLQSPTSDSMDEAERQRLTKEFNAEVAKLQEAQEKAQNDPEVQKINERLEEARTKAMIELNPKVPELQEDLEEAHTKLVQLRQELQQVLAPQP